MEFLIYDSIDALSFHQKLVQQLADNGRLIGTDMEIMAYELFYPIYVQFYRIQIDFECKEEAMRIVEKHIKYFLRNISNNGRIRKI